MTTAEEHVDLANRAYFVDPLRMDPPYGVGPTMGVGSGSHGRTHVVLDAENNPAFPAIAVAPESLSRITRDAFERDGAVRVCERSVRSRS